MFLAVRNGSVGQEVRQSIFSPHRRRRLNEPLMKQTAVESQSNYEKDWYLKNDE